MDGEHRAVHGHAALAVAAPPAVIARRRAVVEPAGEHRLDVRQSRSAACRADRAAHAYRARALHRQRAETGDGRRGRSAGGDPADQASDVIEPGIAAGHIDVDVEDRPQRRSRPSRHHADRAAEDVVRAAERDGVSVVVDVAVKQRVVGLPAVAEGRGRILNVLVVMRIADKTAEVIGGARHRDGTDPSRMRIGQRRGIVDADHTEIAVGVRAFQSHRACHRKVIHAHCGRVAVDADHTVDVVAACRSDGDISCHGDDGVVDRAAIETRDHAVNDVVAVEVAAAVDLDRDVVYRSIVDRDKVAVIVVLGAVSGTDGAAIQCAAEIAGYRDLLAIAFERGLGSLEHHAVDARVDIDIRGQDRRSRARGDRVVRAVCCRRRLARQEVTERMICGGAVKDLCLVVIVKRDGLRVVAFVGGVLRLQDRARQRDVLPARRQVRGKGHPGRGSRHVAILQCDRVDGVDIGRIVVDVRVKVDGRRAIFKIQVAVPIADCGGSIVLGRVRGDDVGAADEIGRDIALRRADPAQKGRRARRAREPTDLGRSLGHEHEHAGDRRVGRALGRIDRDRAGKEAGIGVRRRDVTFARVEPIAERRNVRAVFGQRAVDRQINDLARGVGTVFAQAQHAADIRLAARSGDRTAVAVRLDVPDLAVAAVETDHAADKCARLRAAVKLAPIDDVNCVDRAEIDACDAAEREIGSACRHTRPQFHVNGIVQLDIVESAFVDADDVAVSDVAAYAGDVPSAALTFKADVDIDDRAVVDRDEVAVGVENHPADLLSGGTRHACTDAVDDERMPFSVKGLPLREHAAARRGDGAGDGVVRVQDHRVGVCIAETAARVDAEEGVERSGVGQGRASQCVTIFQIDVAARAVNRQAQQMTVAEICAVDVVGTLVTCARSAGIALELIDIVRSAVKVGNTVEINVLQKSGIRHTIHDFAAPNIRRRRPLGEDISVVSSLDLPVKARSRSVDGLDIVVAAVTVTEQRHGSIPRCGIDVYGVLTFISVAECVKRPRIVVPPARTEIGVVDVDVVCKRSVGRGSAETSADNTDIGAHGIPCLTIDGPSMVGYHACCSICRIRFGSK